jgi:integrase
MKVSKSSHPRYPWRVSWREGRVRRQKFFHTEKQARNYAALVKPGLKDYAASDVRATAEELRAVAEARRLKVPLRAAVELWDKTVGMGKGMTVGELVERREAGLQGVGAKHAAVSRAKLGRIREAIGGMCVAAVRGSDLRPIILAGKSRADQAYTRAVLSALFAVAVEDGILAANPALGIKLTATRPLEAPVIWTRGQADGWLSVVREVAPELLAGWGVAFFAGLRWSEISRLDWSRVRLDRGHIEVTAGTAKTKSRRLVTVTEVLRGVLAPLAGEGLVWPHSPKRGLERCFRAYGGRLPRNVARHSFVSHHLAAHQDVALTELEAGHSRAVLFQHYRELVTREDGVAYFAGLSH